MGRTIRLPRGTMIAPVLVLLMLHVWSCYSQGFFPRLENVGKNKPISSDPSRATCGLAGRSSHCRPLGMDALQFCPVQDGCMQECPRRTATPAPTDLLTAPGACITQDTSDVRPGAQPGSPAYIVRDSSPCFASPPSPPRLGPNSDFTLSVWLKLQDSNRPGTIIEKQNSAGQTIFALTVSTNQLTLDYLTSSGARQLVQNQNPFSTNRWYQLVLQVYDTRLSIFIDGTESDGTPYATQDLQGQITDESSGTSSRIGLKLDGTQQFVGRLQELWFYNVALTNREVQEVYSGTFPELHADSSCRCPPTHPRINPLLERYCIRNGDPDNTANIQLRLDDDAHPLAYINDDDLSSRWVSDFFSSIPGDTVTIDIDLSNGQYEVYYVIVNFYNPQPKYVTIRRKKTDTSPWEDWQFYAEDCAQFGLSNNGELSNPDSVNCLQFPSNPANNDANITFSLLSAAPIERPGYNAYYNTPELMEFVKATQVRVIMQDQYYTGEAQVNARAKFYGLSGITVSGRCICYGHASSCDMEQDTYVCRCLETSFTQGNNCEECQPLYNDKPFRHGDNLNAYNCRPCLCHGHADSCHYNESVDPFQNNHLSGGGGVCDNCQHNTIGRQCDTCADEFYRETGKPLDAVDVCTPCDCNATGVDDDSLVCDKDGGQCACKTQVEGRRCDRCRAGYFNLTETNPGGCEDCSCSLAGTEGGDITCGDTGQCNCKANVINLKCDRCNYGYKLLTASNPNGCEPCQCNTYGSTSQFCNPDTGQCQCKTNVEGVLCDTCVDDYYGLDGSGCKACVCNADGTETGTFCNKTSGQCVCKAYVQGHTCDECRDGFYSLGASPALGCVPCTCTTAGTVGSTTVCNKTNGVCPCKTFVSGDNCNQCQENYWGLDQANPDGCQPCSCDHTGTVAGTACNQATGQCTCLANREGRRCNTCSAGYYVAPNGGNGCLECNCNAAGTQAGTVCDADTGQCQCKLNSGVGGRACDECLPEYFNFDPGSGSCSPCGCDPAGSTNTSCNPNTGQCECKLFVEGDKCDTCVAGSSNLQESNPFGCSKAPSQMPQPVGTPSASTVITLRWQPPDSPNGNYLQYYLYRDNQQIYSVNDTQPFHTQEYEDTALTPFTQYTYYVRATNSDGHADSPTIAVQTLSGIPTGDAVLEVSQIQATSAFFRWQPPSNANGPINNYVLTSVTPSRPTPNSHYTGLATEQLITDLIPFTNYTFTLEACTSGGCGVSDPVVFTTFQAAPEGQGAPTITALSPTELYIDWDYPLQPNGIIIRNELWMRGKPNAQGVHIPPANLIFESVGFYNPRPVQTANENALPPPETNYTKEGLSPYTEYEFQVRAQNQALQQNTDTSPWVTGRTAEAAPLSMTTPTVVGVSSSEVNVTWQEPDVTQARGEILQYEVYIVRTSTDPFAPPDQAELLYTAGGSEFSYVAGGFTPYSQQRFRITACNSVGCVDSAEGRGTTLPEAPSGQAPAIADGYNSSAVTVTWSPPTQLNGPAPNYELRRLPSSFSTSPPQVFKGTYFPGAGYRRFPGTLLPANAAFTGIRLSFRTAHPDGLILFAVSSDTAQSEYLVIQLVNGRPWFLFDVQDAATAVTTTNDAGRRYDDGQWHALEAFRNQRVGRLTVDDYEGTATSSGTSNIIGSMTHLYLGGIPPDFQLVRTDTGDRETSRVGYLGCLKDVTILSSISPSFTWTPVDWTQATGSANVPAYWEGCVSGLQPGVHFKGRGYIKLPTGTFSGGANFDVSFQFRTEILTGLMLFSFGSTGDSYLVVELNMGSLQVEVASGATSIRVETTPSDVFRLCDSAWHTVTIEKNAGTISIDIDSGNVTATRTGSSFTVALDSHLYVGGLPVEGEAAQVVSTKNLDLQPGFGGCLKELSFNSGAAVNFILPDLEVANVALDGCPPDRSMRVCMSDTTSQLYTGQALSFLDTTGLSTFTAYLYQVISSNPAGSTLSQWSSGRTREGAPTGLVALYDPVDYSGYVVGIRWQHPSGNSGVIQQYTLRAYNLDRPEYAPVDTNITDSELTQGNMTNLIPFTNYDLRLVASTEGGSTEGPGLRHRTVQEVPDDVSPPYATATSATELTLRWEEPDRPNGLIQGYNLFRDGSPISRSDNLLRVHTVTGLTVFTTYRFMVEACNAKGCTQSPEAVITTSQLPPSRMDPPTLQVRGAKEIFAEWIEPLELNGILERYIVYRSEVQANLGEVVYNSTATAFRDYTLTNLTGGTTYYIRVAACTGGGCRTSAPSVATTEESAPEGVPAPTVESDSPSHIRASWGPPRIPNGVIISYALYMNNVPVQNTSNLMMYEADGLSAWSLHYFQVQACTARGCGLGPKVSGRTQEAAPEGTVTLEISVLDSRSVRARWSGVGRPNGNVSYSVQFTGIYYRDPDNWDYTTVRDTRSLYISLVTDEWVTIPGLIPYSTYTVQVNASNTKGSILSNTRAATMPQGAPDGVRPPTLEAASATSIRATWDAVGRNNAPGNADYRLEYRQAGSNSGQIVFGPSTSRSHTQTGLRPYTEYEFRVIAGNNYGQTESEWAAQFTSEDRPGSIDAPLVEVIDAYTLHVTWERPAEPNGILTEYRLYQNSARQVTVPSNTTQYRMEGLMPYTDYTYRVEVCTRVGCTSSSDSITVTTPPATPGSFAPPSLSSQTPTSVTIRWSEPASPNGILRLYTLQRRLKGSSAAPDVVANFLPTQSRTYLDQSDTLQPYTTYEYRMLAYVQDITEPAYSDWAEVTTQAARPAGLSRPTVQVLGPTSMFVTWLAPSQPNGALTRYVIRMPDPRIELTNTNITSYTVEGLVPYTSYSVTIQACTAAGCTQSSATPASTQATVPGGQAAPEATPISDSYISVFWQPPTFPNGPNIRYELIRTKTRQPLVTAPPDLMLPMSVYSGTALSYDDRGLSRYTTFEYQVTVYNDIGPFTSNATEATTLPGVPTTPANLTATTLNHTAIRVQWTPPSVIDLQGGVQRYDLRYTGGGMTQTMSFPPSDTETVVGDLRPSTLYSFIITIDNGAHTIDSAPAEATTMDGTPEGLDPPVTSVVSGTEVQVSWTAPQTPNGQVTAYNIYVSGGNQLIQNISTGMTQAGSYIVGQLQPYTIYTIQVEVCTVFACLVSEGTLVTTLETAPSGIAAPTLQVLSSSSIRMTWSPPAQPNGIIQGYRISRTAYLPCSVAPAPTPNPDADVCSYIECGSAESLCGTQCYSGARDCCDGTLYNTVPGYECCNSSYITGRADPSDVCCGGQLHPQQENYQCCGGQYVEVGPGQICCPSPDQDRVSVGSGDACCGDVPFYSSQGQVCCGGMLFDGFERQCCGGSMVQEDMTCCGGEEDGQAYASDSGSFCCGNSYVAAATTRCCESDSGSARVHTYDSEDDKNNDNRQCCGLNLVRPDLSCCNNVGFNSATHVCADRPYRITSSFSDCGDGVTCPISQTAGAFCNRCDFSTSSSICTIVEGAYEGTVSSTPQPTTNPGICTQETSDVYTGGTNVFSFTDTSLEPYTQYEYQVVVVNAGGEGTSEASLARTRESSPEQVSPPEWSVTEGEYNVVNLEWEEPGKPNGVIIRYSLLRADGAGQIFRQVYQGLARQYRDLGNIRPYQEYIYKLRAYTSVGYGESEEVTVATLQMAPAQVQPPAIMAVSSTRLNITWRDPGQPNGIIREYRLNLVNETYQTVLYTQMDMEDPKQYLHTGLDPYTEYSYSLTACTAAGCTNSDPAVGRTGQDIPQDVSRPRFVVVSSTEIEVYWSEPGRPNGVITHYQLLRDNNVIYSGDNMTFTDSGLTPSTTYTYQVAAHTSVGPGRGSPLTQTTPSSTPEGIPAANVTVISATVIYAEWEIPAEPNGIIQNYYITLNYGMEGGERRAVGNQLNFSVTGLTPYTEYEIRVMACTDECGLGPKVFARTREAPPSGQEAPKLVAVGPRVVEISWEPPLQANGEITRYQVFRREFGTNQRLLVLETALNQERKGTDTNLQPYTQYEYKVVSRNSQGETESPWTLVRTLEDSPSGMQTPTAQAIGAYSISISWEPPTTPNGEISQYIVQYQEQSNDPTLPEPIVTAVTVASPRQQATISGMKPYTEYRVRVTAVNSAGATTSPWTPVRTAEAAPRGVGLFSVVKAPDGNSMDLSWDEPTEPNGAITEYRIYEIGENGQIQMPALYVGVTKEYTFRRLTPYTTYTLILEACTLAGCARSERQALTTAETLPDYLPSPTTPEWNGTHVVISWTNPVNPNGRIIRYEVIRRQMPRTLGRNIRQTGESVVYETTDTDEDNYMFVDSNLTPYTVYEYRVRAHNSIGSVDSPWIRVETAQAAPANVEAPVVEYIGSNARTLRIKWTAPATPNGVIQSYQLQRNDSAPISFSAADPRLFDYQDPGLEPYTVYSYTITACTTGGCTVSQPATRRTLETAPLQVEAPVIAAINSTAVQATWSYPRILNGEINNFELKADGITRCSGLVTTCVVDGLISYREYGFVVRACTGGGCTDSPTTLARTTEARPTNQQSPTLRVLSSTVVEVTWDEPLYPNGVIRRYEVRRDGNLVYDESDTRYTDYGLTPGRQYSYTVEAFNSIGGTGPSPPALINTIADIPAGLDPPTLTALSSTAIRAEWMPPAFPNGIIQNYTLYVDGSPRYTLTGDTFQRDVYRLQPYTQYVFFLEACTLKGCVQSSVSREYTSEAPPVNQALPVLTQLADSLGAMLGIQASWGPPSDPRGIITEYRLYRRLQSTSNPVFVYNGSAAVTVYSDTDNSLQPATFYEYIVVSVNSAGTSCSSIFQCPWQSVKTGDSRPEGLQAPTFSSITGSQVTVNIAPPARPNGDIVKYDIQANVSGVLQVLVSTVRMPWDITNLHPYTNYEFRVAVFTNGGSTLSPPAYVRTLGAAPTGQGAPNIRRKDTDAIYLIWDYPANRNGIINRFELRQRRACPLTSQPVAPSRPCTTQQEAVVYNGPLLMYNTTELVPYTNYEFMVTAFNEHGEAPSSWQLGTTLPAPPTAVNVPDMTSNQSFVHVDWSDAFSLNGYLEEYVLFDNEEIRYSGLNTAYDIYRSSVKVYTIRVEVRTAQGQASTVTATYNPDTGAVLVPTPATRVSTPWYHSVWFVVTATLVAMILLLIIIALFLRRAGTRKPPYERQRAPLAPRQKRRTPLAECVYPAPDGSIMTMPAMRPPTASSRHTRSMGRTSQASYSHLNPAYAHMNPAYSHTSLHSSRSGMVDPLEDIVVSDKLSGKFLDDDDDAMWDGHVPADSGLYDPDEVESSDGSVSFQKEHTMFTDTHL
ncbi:usherin-like isoform X2 [Branchiostoma floridae x Branchiostoma belcheri]